MKSRTRQFISLAVLFLSAAAPAAATELYTVDDMLSVESIGKVRFDPSGERLIYEHFGPFDEQSDYSRNFVIGELRSRIYAVELEGDEAPALLFPQNHSDGYTIGGLSPDGRFLAFYRLSEEGLQTGVAPLGGGAPTLFDVAAGYNPLQAVEWTGAQYMFETLPAGEVDLSVGLGKERVERLIDLWRQRNHGEVATAGRIGSGRFASLPESTGSLALASALNGEVRTLARGPFSSWFPSPDGSAVAALREQHLDVDPNQPLEHGANIGGIERRLLVIDPRGGPDTAPRDVCPECDVLLGSVSWSPSSPVLAFVARDAGAEWSAARFRVYDHRTGETRAVELGNLVPYAGRAGAQLSIQSAWIGDRLAVLARRPEATGGRDARADWYLVGGGAPANLTAAFEGETPQLIAVGPASLVVLHGDEAWRIDAASNRTNLTADIAEEVQAWSAPNPFRRFEIQHGSTLTLEIASENEGTPDRLLFVDLATGAMETLTAPSSHSEFVTVSPSAHRAAVTDTSENVTTLMVVDAQGERREIVHLNEHLRDVVGGTPVRIDHRGPNGDARMSWILLPPGYQPGQRVPTIVNVYPGSVGRETWTKWRLDQAHALNDHILAAQGYAVLYPSLPVHYEEVPRDPLDGLVEEVFAAVDAAVAQGYVDPDRLAVQGQSYGGYTTGALVGLTNRFRTAVAQAGLYDLISSYGQFDIRSRFDIERTGLNLFASSLMETSQGGMGAPPWDDPERYLRNSPLMHVKDVQTPILLISGDRDYVSTTQAEEFFTALTRLDKDAVFVRYYGEGHVFNSPANIRDMWRRILDWYDVTLRAPAGPAAAAD